MYPEGAIPAVADAGRTLHAAVAVILHAGIMYTAGMYPIPHVPSLTGCWRTTCVLMFRGAYGVPVSPCALWWPGMVIADSGLLVEYVDAKFHNRGTSLLPADPRLQVVRKPHYSLLSYTGVVCVCMCVCVCVCVCARVSVRP